MISYRVSKQGSAFVCFPNLFAIWIWSAVITGNNTLYMYARFSLIQWRKILNWSIWAFIIFSRGHKTRYRPIMLQCHRVTRVMKELITEEMKIIIKVSTMEQSVAANDQLLWCICCIDRPVMYTVFHKKGTALFSSITIALLGRFL